MTRFRFASLFVLILIFAPARADELKVLGGKDAVTGSLEKISEKDIVINGVATPVSQALQLTLRTNRAVPATEKYIDVNLADDSVLRCTKIVFGVKDSQLTLTTGALVKAPTSAILTVLRDAEKTKLKEQWTSLLKSKKRTDRIFVLRDGDLNPIDGAFGAIDETTQKIKFKPDNTPEIEPALEKLQGMQFARTDAAGENGLCEITDVDGNRLVATKLLYDAGQFTVTTPFGQKVALENKLVATINYNMGKLVFLSDLDAKMPPAVFLGGFNPVRKDLNLDGSPIVLADKQYAKGLSIYAGAELVYDLKGEYKKFTAMLGADSRIAEEGQGKVTVSIYCGREKRFSQEVSTKAAIPVSIDLRDVETLKIIVSGTNFTNFSGHATLANAHVSK